MPKEIIGHIVTARTITGLQIGLRPVVEILTSKGDNFGWTDFIMLDDSVTSCPRAYFAPLGEIAPAFK